MILNSGWCKGLKLQVPKGIKTRPTSAKVRESLLNMLLAELEDGVIVDLFAGTGSVGLSALSRGARGCVFVEKDGVAFTALAQNVAEAKRRAEKQGIAVHPLTALNCAVSAAYGKIAALCTPRIVWADPPYEMTVSWLMGAEQALLGLTAPGSFLAVESATADLEGLVLNSLTWELVRQRSFDDSTLTIWQRREEQSDG